jgi:hypothetical protein
MNARDFEKLAEEVLNVNIQLFEPENPEYKYTQYNLAQGNIKPSTKYGVYIDGMIQYDFKTTKKIETFFKSFVNQHIRKYEMKKESWELVDGEMQLVKPKKEDIIKRYTSDRVSKYHYYTTLYGIGMFAYFTTDINRATASLAKYLKENGIEYTNEFSDAGWAYRFCINRNVEEHNEILENFEI